MDEISVVKTEVKYAEWIAMVEECRSSGLSIRAWCEENNVNLKTYHYRLRRLRTMFLDQHKKNTVPEIRKLSVVTPSVPVTAYSGAAEPPVRRGVSHVSGPDGATLLELM